jgi:hypothetical protein
MAAGYGQFARPVNAAGSQREVKWNNAVPLFTPGPDPAVLSDAVVAGVNAVIGQSGRAAIAAGTARLREPVVQRPSA